MKRIPSASIDVVPRMGRILRISRRLSAGVDREQRAQRRRVGSAPRERIERPRVETRHEERPEAGLARVPLELQPGAVSVRRGDAHDGGDGSHKTAACQNHLTSMETMSTIPLGRRCSARMNLSLSVSIWRIPVPERGSHFTPARYPFTSDVIDPL